MTGDTDQTAPPESSAIEAFPRLHAKTRRFSLGAPRSFSVVADGAQVVFVRYEYGIDPELALWTLDTTTGQETKLVDPKALQSSGELSPAEKARRERARESAGGVVSYSAASAAPLVAFALGGSLFTTNLLNGQTSGHPAQEPVFDPRPNASGTHVAYVSGAQLRVVELASGDDRCLSPHESSETARWGSAEFIAAEEMGRGRGFWWSPDGRHVLAERVDEEPVVQWFISDPANPDREPVENRYPAAGTANADVSLAVLSLHGGAPITVPWDAGTCSEGEPFEYRASAGWSPTGDIMVSRQTRNQRALSVGIVPAPTEDSSALKVLREVRDPVWVELQPGAPILHNDHLLTIEDVGSETPKGYRALCVDGEPITAGNLHVRSLSGVVNDHAVITAWTDATEVQVFAVPLASGPRAPGSPTAVALTTEAGVHSVVAANDTVIITSSSPDSYRSQTRISSLTDLEAAASELRPPSSVGHSLANVTHDPGFEASATYLTLGPRQLSAALFLPSDHDGSSKLPVLLDPYGGPHAQRVLKTHNSHLVSRWFAEQGFAVLVVDGRGTPGRGPHFEREVWGDLAAPVLEDQLDALDAAAAETGVLDLNRVGIRGWSFGGYLAALAVMRAPERVHAAIAGAPVTTWELYDTHYTERYLGTPQAFPQHYKQTDLLVDAENLAQPLLLIHGLADDNVVAAHTLRLSSALLAHGHPHRVLPLSGVTHMTPQEVVAENLLLLQRDFLRETVVSRSDRP